MPKVAIRSYSRYSREAVGLLGALIRIARKERKMTAEDVAQRAGISRGLLQRIEKGDMKCEIGAAFEVAAILGIQLFSADDKVLSEHRQRAEAKLALLPKSIRKVEKAVDDDF